MESSKLRAKLRFEDQDVVGGAPGSRGIIMLFLLEPEHLVGEASPKASHHAIFVHDDAIFAWPCIFCLAHAFFAWLCIFCLAMHFLPGHEFFCLAAEAVDFFLVGMVCGLQLGTVQPCFNCI